MNTQFGVGNILGEDNLLVIFEYNKKNKDLIVGQDLITGISLMSTYSPERRCDVVTLESDKLLNKGFIQLQYYEQISRRKMIEYLKRMSNEDIEIYTNRMNDILSRITKGEIIKSGK